MKMIATLVAAFSLALAGAALAADTTTGTTGSTSTTASTPAPEASPAVAKTTKPAASKSVSGSFVKADSTANTVTLKIGSKEMTYNVSADTKVTKGGKDITWADLKEGDRVSGKAQGDKLTMLSVKGAMKSKSTASPAPSPAAAK